MKICYDKLWKKVKENKLKKKDLAAAADLSSNTMTKLSQDKTVSMETILRLCKVFHCDIGDLMEIIEEDNK